MPVVTVQCPRCSRSYSVDGSLAWRTARCKGCGHAFTLTPCGEMRAGTAASADGSSGGENPDARPQDPAPPAMIGRFQVTQRLGAGAFGTVYRATDPILGREVALKVPRPGLLGNPGALERFLREARAAAGLRHAHIVTVYETGIDRGEHYIASEFVDGSTLAAAIGPDGIEPRHAAEIIAALAEALHFAHAQGIIHRDVKPANIMIDRDGRPHLMDFGLARIEGSRGERLTQAGTVVGTPAYLAPEQAAEGGIEADAASDQYSLGVTLYELLTARTPFSGAPEVVLYNLAHHEIPRPRGVRRGIPADLETVCLKAMARDPRSRYANCRDLAEDLGRWVRDEPIAARRPGLIHTARRWARGQRLATALAASLVAVLFLLALCERDTAAEGGRPAARDLGQRSHLRRISRARRITDARTGPCSRLDKIESRNRSAQTQCGKAERAPAQDQVTVAGPCRCRQHPTRGTKRVGRNETREAPPKARS